MGQYEVVFEITKKVETVLVNGYGAQGRGLHEKMDNVQDQLSPAVMKKIRYLASVRNKLSHEDGFQVDDLDAYQRVGDEVLNELGYDAAESTSATGNAGGNSGLGAARAQARAQWQARRGSGDLPQIEPPPGLRESLKASAVGTTDDPEPIIGRPERKGPLLVGGASPFDTPPSVWVRMPYLLPFLGAIFGAAGAYLYFGPQTKLIAGIAAAGFICGTRIFWKLAKLVFIALLVAVIAVCAWEILRHLI